MNRWTTRDRGLGLVLALLCVPVITHAGSSLDLGFASTGVSIGNSARWRGIRLNAVDRDVESVIGLDLTLWKPRANPEATFGGVALGIYGKRAARLDGLAVGLVAHEVEHQRGIALAGLGLGTVHDARHSDTSDADLTGIAIAGLGIGAGSIDGVAVAGLGMGCNDLDGVAIAGLGLGANDVRGIVVAGLGLGANDVRGIVVAGLGLGANDVSGLCIGGLGIGANNVNGIFIGGLGMGADDVSGLCVAGLGVGGDQLRGVFLSGLGVGGDTMDGIAVTGLGVGADTLRGIGIGLGMIRTVDSTGFTASAFNRARGDVRGLQIGVLNMADTLRGVQIGLLNHVASHPAAARWLPVLNCSF